MKFKMPSLTMQIFIGLLVGVAVGHFMPQIGIALKPFGKLFLSLIKAIIAPLVFATLVVGIAGTGSLKAFGRMGLKALIYFEIVTTIALFIGLAAVNLMQPGAGINIVPDPGADIPAQKPQTFTEILLHMFPTSIIDAMARGDVLQIVVFTVIFSMGVMAAGAKAEPIYVWCESLAEVMFKFTNFIMHYAPFGVCAAIAATVGAHGLHILKNLGLLILTLYLALIVFVVVVLGTVAFIIRLPLKAFFRAVKEPMIIAFSTTSSEAALPLAMENMEAMGVPRKIVSFVLPTGYSFNLDGTTLYLALAAIFVAQAAGQPMSFGQQIVMMLTLMLTSKGVAGVPRASLVILAGTLATFGLPVEAVGMILGVDELMDMARTAVNVLGNCLATVVVAKWEGQFDPREDFVEPV
ncbi:MAG: cation:dicarboxylase symporter family transporter [Armatimonadetes bacterium]|nr:cation:dicarboxylase symporter family transporter [Armatimonadota bacterium]